MEEKALLSQGPGLAPSGLTFPPQKEAKRAEALQEQSPSMKTPRGAGGFSLVRVSHT